MFFEFFAPAICYVCMTYGAAEVGFKTHGVELGAGWIDYHLTNGRVDDDTIFASAAAALWRRDRYSAGVFAAGVVDPDNKGPHPRRFEAGPWFGVKLGGPASIRLHVFPDPAGGFKNTQAMISLLIEVP